ncbi:hypothetical protein FB440_11852 [Vibrio crassostreae]|nr:hypothetical protein EDB60_101136 [Vibrio crassostreae]TWD33263.1 hypothetical protein FB440_11852 [Vibrio crassostreae]
MQNRALNGGFDLFLNIVAGRKRFKFSGGIPFVLANARNQ